MSGQAALLWQGNQFIDTVDVAFGIHALSNGALVFLPVRTFDTTLGMVGPTSHVLLTTEGQRRDLGTSVPYFDSCFSAPVLDGDDFLYWGLRKEGDQGWALYAVRYSLTSGRLDTLLIDTQPLATDDCSYLPLPSRGSTGYRFGDRMLSSQWSVVR